MKQIINQNDDIWNNFFCAEVLTSTLMTKIFARVLCSNLCIPIHIFESDVFRWSQLNLGFLSITKKIDPNMGFHKNSSKKVTRRRTTLDSIQK